jgi:ketosteroid isomerase-like protein
VLTDQQKLAAAEAFIAATGSNDGAAVTAMCAPGALTWHNYDNLEAPSADTGKALDWVHQAVPDVVWQTRSLKPTSDGFVWQATLTGTAPGGPLNAYSCVIISLDDDGRIKRIEEYLDRGQTRVMLG